MPKITVLMSIYNGEPYLREAMESILGQTFHDFEFLIINDGSTDKTREIVQSYDDLRIRLVNNGQNLGLTRSLNRGLELAKGEFIARQDADDISEPERLANQVAFMERHTETVLLGTWYKSIDTLGATIAERELPCDWLQIRWWILFICPFVHSSVMLRKSVLLEKIGFYNEEFLYAQDWELWSRIALSLPVANLNKHLVQYRANPWSMTTAATAEVEDEPLRIRIANIGRLLGWARTDRMESHEIQVNNMIALLSLSRTKLSPMEAIKTVEAILLLSSAFYHYYGMDELDRRAHRKSLWGDITQGLIKILHHCLDQDDYSGARRLFLETCRLYPPFPLAHNSMRLTCKLLMGPHLVKIVKSFIKPRIKVISI